MSRDSTTGNRALALFEAMLMALVRLLALAGAGAGIGRVPASARGAAIGFPQADDAATAPSLRRGSLARGPSTARAAPLHALAPG
jgi:hypothetical protein